MKGTLDEILKSTQSKNDDQMNGGLRLTYNTNKELPRVEFSFDKNELKSMVSQL